MSRGFGFVFPTAAVALLVIFILTKRPEFTESQMIAEVDIIEEILESNEMYRNLEMFATLEEIDLSDEEWQILLGEEG